MNLYKTMLHMWWFSHQSHLLLPIKKMGSYNAVAAFLLFVSLFLGGSLGQLSENFYDSTCPRLPNIVRREVKRAIDTDIRAGAKLIRFHFHDCFVQGCDGSVLLEDDPGAGIVSELNGLGNLGIQGLEIVDAIKAAVEAECPGVVSCADILAQASKDSVDVQGGPSWRVLYGRRDSRTANKTGADNLPSPFETLDPLKKKFQDVDLNSTDLVALSGAHTFGRSRCLFFNGRFSNFSGSGRPDPTLDPAYRQQLERACTDGQTRVNFDPTTPDTFDKNYYTNLQANRGLLTSDQVLFSTPGADTIDIVNLLGSREGTFFRQFRLSMIKMGNIRPLTGNQGEIRRNCRRVNDLGQGAGAGHDVM
ncbi:peroxidase 2-like [Momordica charantia]|uniref:Peroxidase n=1 Tax=Momordica charantia TaxID=3673 RepID=A0A6J1DHN9_MOMCH|nr:peroxidase 2-like [Momordica charantia]